MKISKKTTLLVSAMIVAAAIALFFIADARQGSPASVVRVGAVLPLTGPTSYLGQGESAGIRLALAEQSEGSSPKVEFVFEDSQGKADLAINAVQKLLDVQGLQLHTVFTTTPVIATLPVFRDSRRDVLVIAQCMIPEVTKGFPFAYRFYATSDEETDLLADHANRNGWKRFAALHINNRFGEEGVAFFAKKVAAGGGQLLLKEQFTFADKDFRTLLEKIKALGVDAMVVYAYSTTFPTLFQQMQEIGLDIPVMGNLDLALGGLQDKVAPGFLEKVVFPAPRYYFAESDPNARAFNEKVKALGLEPNIDIAYSYDMARLLIAAIKKAGSGDPSVVGAAMVSLMPFDGATGTIHLTADRDTRADMRLVRWGPRGIEEVPRGN